MIGLPPGCTVNYAITVEITKMTNDIADWYKLIGGVVTNDDHYNHRGIKVTNIYVQYGRGKRCHYRQDGTRGIRLHFAGEDAAVASMFLIKFMDLVETHNLKEHAERIIHESY